ncbi:MULTISPECIES: peptide deformylase [Collinsella]|uniref:peptide deformylase n=1 Tax=Collinsella TaxID=102106 RepID=UPI000B37C047|nr:MULTISPECIES: peptide deformylase [Collinsella]MDM8163182.1 peptide deformylase [Collinsella intestinalis]OUO63643.1 formylmethionine deformylase [Collinsella sp. An268]HIU05890.1 peptide deformylase [Candidatus Coprousia avicola]
MIKEIVKDREFLSKPAEEATAADTQVIEDLRDTLASLEDAVCLAANQIGSTKAVIAYRDGDRIAVMLNPKIKRGAQPYKTQESCLSLEDLSEVRRFQMVTVAYQVLAGENLVSRTKRLSGWTAEVVQHAIDHCAGKLV